MSVEIIQEGSTYKKPRRGKCKKCATEIKCQWGDTAKQRPEWGPLDLAWPAAKVGVEVQGGTYARNRGAHSRPRGQARDFKKLNCAAMLGWRVLQFDAKDLEPRAIIQTILTCYATIAAVDLERAAK